VTMCTPSLTVCFPDPRFRWHKNGIKRSIDKRTVRTYWVCSGKGADGIPCTAQAIETEVDGKRSNLIFRQDGTEYDTAEELEHVHERPQAARLESTVVEQMRRRAKERPDLTGTRLVHMRAR
jgi:hypothetical protein